MNILQKGKKHGLSLFYSREVSKLRQLNFRTSGMRKTTITLLLILPALLTQAQEEPGFMESSGKIWVVVATIIALFIGIVVFLFVLDRKITALEHQIES